MSLSNSVISDVRRRRRKKRKQQMREEHKKTIQEGEENYRHWCVNHHLLQTNTLCRNHYLNFRVLFDSEGSRIRCKFLFAVCGHVWKMEKKAYLFDPRRDCFFVWCDICDAQRKVDSFNCLGCFGAGRRPLTCKHSSESMPACKKVLENGSQCEQASRINNSGYCIHHQNIHLIRQRATDCFLMLRGFPVVVAQMIVSYI